MESFFPRKSFFEESANYESSKCFDNDIIFEKESYWKSLVTSENTKWAVNAVKKYIPSGLSNWKAWNLWKQWIPTSDDLLRDAEAAMLQGFGLPLQQMMVNAGAHTINTIIAGQGTPLVMLHGFAAGIGLWTHNIKEFAQHHTVYAIDLPGFGRSSRTPFTGTTAQEAEDYFVEALESWRKEMGLEKFVLLGHSFGGYISGCYSLRYPQHVDHLILADSWGLSQMPEKGGLSDIPSWKRAARKVFLLMTPISALQYAGPCGPKLIEAFRRDLANKFSNFYESVSVVSDYLYHMNVQHPSGATAFACLHISLRWSKTPLCQRIHALDSNIPVTLVFGSDTWIDREAGSRLGHNYGRNIPCHVISNSGHHIYADNPVEFNQVILGASKSVQQVHLGPEQSCILQEAHL